MFFIRIRSSRSLMFFKKGVRPATLLKKRPWNWCFFVNFAKFLRTPLFMEHLWWLLLKDGIRAAFFLGDTVSHVRCSLLCVFHTGHIFYVRKTLTTESDTRKNKIFYFLIYASSEPCQTSKIERFAKIFND